MEAPLNDPRTSALPPDGTGNREAHPKVWLVAEVRIYHEKRVALELSKLGIDHFLPIQECYHLWSDRRKKIKHVLIPMKIFVHIEFSRRVEVLRHPSVLRYMTMFGQRTPTVIPNEQMERFIFMLDHSETAVSLSNEPLEVGEKVRAIKGSLLGLEGELSTIEGNTKISIRLGSLGCATVGIPLGYVERIK